MKTHFVPSKLTSPEENFDERQIAKSLVENYGGKLARFRSSGRITGNTEISHYILTFDGASRKRWKCRSDGKRGKHKNCFPRFPQPLEIAKERRFHTFPPHGYCYITMTFTLCTLSDISALHQHGSSSEVWLSETLPAGHGLRVEVAQNAVLHALRRRFEIIIGQNYFRVADNPLRINRHIDEFGGCA